MTKAAHDDAPTGTRRQGDLEASPDDGDEKGEGGVQDSLFFAGQEVNESGERDGVGQLALRRGLREEHLAVHVLRGEDLRGESKGKGA